MGDLWESTMILFVLQNFDRGILMTNFFPGLCCGIIIFQTGIIAPIITKEVKGDLFSLVVRTIWPRFFLVLVIASSLGLLIEILTGVPSASRIGILFTTIILPLVCYMLIPATNAATDTGRARSFKWLHATSIILTVLSLLLNTCCIFVE